MKQSCPANIGVEKLKSSFFVGMTSNSSTLIGLVAVWIAFSKLGFLDGFWATILTVISFGPIFMGDALDSYCLNRIKVEQEKGWNDIQITEVGRKNIAKYFFFFRLLSILPSAALAIFMLLSFTIHQDAFYYSKIAIVFFFSISFFKSIYFMNNYLAPKIPALGGGALTKKAAIVSLVFLAWFVYLWLRPQVPFSKLFILANGFIYFLLSALLHPLPSRFSIFRPGRKPKKKFSFKVEIIDEQCGLGNWDEIQKVSKLVDEHGAFQFVDNVKLPLLELPLFETWGKMYVDNKNETVLFVLASETKSIVHRSLVSHDSVKYYITTDFGAPQAKFPQTVLYENVEKSIALDEFINIHDRKCAESKKTMGITNPEIYGKLEQLVKIMICFLESEIPRGKVEQSNS